MSTELAVTPMDLLQVAMSQNVDADKLMRLWELQQLWEANEAKKAFNSAMTEFKLMAPKITKNKHVDYTTKSGFRIQYDHATLDHVCDVIIDALAKVGISHRWVPKEAAAGRLTIMCILTHRKGHSETAELTAPHDDSGNKNPLQAMESTDSYLRRYTLLAVTGMAAGTRDDDGRSAATSEEKVGISDERYIELTEWIEAAKTREELQKAFGLAYKEAKSIKDEASMKSLQAVYDARKKVI